MKYPSKKLGRKINSVDGIVSIHHVHFWQVNENDIHFEAHVKVEDMKVSRTEELLAKVEKLLREEFIIGHVTLQFECSQCETDDLI